jgi:diadenosine tetraphosphate (Ap4A) HIT family hydrolase
MSMSDCVFCSRAEQPEVLFETGSLYVMPDKFPLLPGHILIVSKQHLRCHAEAPGGMEAELESAAARVRRFLRDAYGTAALAWENGVSGQTVFHAHLHLLPVPPGEFPIDLDAHGDVAPLDGWQPIRDHFTRHGGYHYLEFAGHRRLIAGRSPALAVVQRWLAQTTGLQRNGREWIKATTVEDVTEVTRRWAAWTGDEKKVKSQKAKGKRQKSGVASRLPI